MQEQIIIFVIAMSTLFLGMYIHNVAAQNATNNASNVATNLTEAAQNATNNASSLRTNLTDSANRTFAEFGHQLSSFVKGMNITLQSENSSLNQLGKNASDLELEILNNSR